MSAIRPGYDKFVSSSVVIDFTKLESSTTQTPVGLPEPILNSSSKNKRCNHTNCNKKLTLLDLNCKCGLKFCLTHRMPEDHLCSFDFKDTTTKLLQKQLIKIDGSKLEKI